MNSKVTAYIGSAPEAQRAALVELRAMIGAALPHSAEELGSSGFPVYTVNGRWVSGFATRKKGPMFYMMVGEVMAGHAEELGPLMSGKSCIEYRASKTMTMDEVRGVVRRMLVEAAGGAE